MSTPRTAFALLAAAASLAAQQLPALRTEAVSAGSVFYVKNTAAQPLTAYLIELVDYPGSSFTLFEDELGAPVAPGAEKPIPVTNMTVGAAPEYVKLTAALYVDGTAAGDPAKVALIQGRRKALADTSRELIARLEKAKAAGTPKAAVAAELKQWSESLQSDARSRRMTVASVSQAASRQAISGALARLESGSIDDALSELHALAAKL